MTSNTIFVVGSTWVIIPYINTVEYDDSKYIIYIKLAGDKITLKFQGKSQFNEALTNLMQKIEGYYANSRKPMFIKLRRGTAEQHAANTQPLGTMSLVTDAPELRFQTHFGSQVIPVDPELHRHIVAWHQDINWFQSQACISELLDAGLTPKEISERLSITEAQVEQTTPD